MAKSKPPEEVTAPILDNTHNNSCQFARSRSSSAHTSKKNTLNLKKLSNIDANSTLTISRNKHWRYISAFHGPWLQLPLEILQTLAQGNYFSFGPRQTDAAVLFDLLKIRKLVDDAADLAVRAQNGIASSTLQNSRGDGLGCNSLRWGSRDDGHCKLSPERKFRMRELATQKLSQAYCIDEIAASVATMQSASALDSVANLVLQRNPVSMDGRYVHFFHEKIPSRMMSEYTSLTHLDDLIRADTANAAYYRTRASVKVFKEDYNGAIRDLTEALALCRAHSTMHTASKLQLVATQSADRSKAPDKDLMQEKRLSEEDQPSSLEMQLLFQRGNQYLTIACQNIRTVFDSLEQVGPSTDFPDNHDLQNSNEAMKSQSTTLSDTSRPGLQYEIVRKYAKRALNDYTTFFTHIDYAHNIPRQGSQDHFGLNSDRSSSTTEYDSQIAEELSDVCSTASESPTALVRHEEPISSSIASHVDSPKISSQFVHSLSEILSATPPRHLPPFPSVANRSTHRETTTFHPLLHETLYSFLLAHCILQTASSTLSRIAQNVARVISLTDGYPFFLSARSPARADWSEILRKTRGYFNLGLGRAMRPTDGASVVDSWETLCKPCQSTGWVREEASSRTHAASTKAKSNSRTGSRESSSNGTCAFSAVAIPGSSDPGSNTVYKNFETESECKQRIRKECVLEALGDERVIDDDLFKRAVIAREQRAWSDIETKQRALRSDSMPLMAESISANSLPAPVAPISGISHASGVGSASTGSREKRSGGRKDEAYFIGTERAELITRWILEAPVVVEAPGSSRKKKKGKANRKKTEVNSQLGGVTASEVY